MASLLKFRPVGRFLKSCAQGASMIVLAASLAACSPVAEKSADVIPVRFDGKPSAELLRFYVGAYTSAVDSVVAADGSGLMAEPLRRHAPLLADALEAAIVTGAIEREALEEAVVATYRRARGLTGSLDSLADAIGLEAGPWLSLDVDGSMTRYRRRLRIREDAVRSAVQQFLDHGTLVYDPGTAIVGEHLSEGAVVETTVMIRREEGLWDFLAYGATGRPVRAVHGTPDSLAVPTRCFGCHYGTRLFEPERSFPGESSDGPAGPRAVHTPWRDQEVASLLDEHRRRSDGVLGVYATVWLSRLRAARADELSDADRTILDRVERAIRGD